MDRTNDWQALCWHDRETWKCRECRWSAVCSHGERIQGCLKCKEILTVFQDVAREMPNFIRQDCVNSSIHGITLVHMAVDKWCTNSLKYLLDHKADLSPLPFSNENVFHILGRSGLCHESMEDPIQIVNILASSGQIISLLLSRDKGGQRAYDLLCPFVRIRPVIRDNIARELTTLRDHLLRLISVKPLVGTVLDYVLPLHEALAEVDRRTRESFL
jgi:hypothetical protein